MADWQSVLDVQLELHRFLTSSEGIRYGSSWFASVYESNAGGEYDGSLHQWTSLEAAALSGSDFARHLGVQAFNAEPIWVEPDMMTIIEAAAVSFRPEPLRETDLITTNGLLVLPRSLWVDAGPNPSGYRRMSWRIAQWAYDEPGRKVLLALYHDFADPDDVDEGRRAEWLAGRKSWDLSKLTPYIPNHVVNWPVGQNHPTALVNQPLVDGTPNIEAHHADDVQLQMQAIWRLLSQTIAVNVKARPPRGYVKRAQRAKLPTEHITIVRLRRPASPPKEGEPDVVAWTHRWITGAHWRWQWYRNDALTDACGHIEPGELPCNATGGVHRQIWINAFTKGPEHLPLIVNKARIFVFER